MHADPKQAEYQLSLVRLSGMVTPQGGVKEDLLELARHMRNGIKESYVEDVSPCLLFAYQEDAFRLDWLNDSS